MHCEYMNHLYHSVLVASLVREILPFNVTKKHRPTLTCYFELKLRKGLGFKKKHQNSAKKNAANLRSKRETPWLGVNGS